MMTAEVEVGKHRKWQSEEEEAEEEEDLGCTRIH